ncbi:MAG: alpha/beta hydrolase [Terriglobia bacterium]
MNHLTLPFSPAKMPAQTQPSLQFTETMRGYCSAKVTDDYHSGDEQGRFDGSRFEFTLTIATDDIAQALEQPGHRFCMVGTVCANALSARPLTVTEGVFQLLVKDPANVDTRRMIYQMKMVSKEGRTFFFDGFKVIHEGLPNNLWPETTTLYITVYDGESSSSPLFGKGILRMAPEDFLHQLTTLRVSDADPAGQLEATARFGRFFAGVLWDTYGGIVTPPHYLKADAPPRKQRPLRAPAPELHFFNTADGVQLRFLRYRGGSKGPVILTHGIGVSSLIFRIDTIETNLVEFLVARGFDVWALDYRGSIELASHALQFTADDVAAYDYPAAVEKVRELTGAASVQMVVHCFGSVSFFMAMLKGLKGVRSAVCSQVATHMVTAPLTELKCGLYIPEVLDALGVKSLNTYVTSAAWWQEKLDEAAMRFYPMPEDQLCTSPVCHRITFMYSQVFEHQQLNAATHGSLHETFGATNIRAFEHLSRMVRTGHIVTAEGANAYLPHLERLAIPIAFISGGENRCFLPETTEITYNLLSEKNGKHLYTRTVIPHYGHADSILGKNAALDVYPAIAEHLEATA